jgi:transposase-like protein
MKSKQEMYPVVRLWLESTLLKQDFCEKHDISYHCLNYWIKKYRKEKQIGTTSPMGFVPITIKESLTRETGITPEIELDLPHGIRLRIY